MQKKILILGAGFGGLEAATSLAEALPESYAITLIDKSDHFIFGFSKFEVMFGRKPPEGIKHFYRNIKNSRVKFVQDVIERIDPDRKLVATSGGEYPYDYLIVGLGADLAPAGIPGFIESGGHEFYSLSGAEKLFPVIDRFVSGRLILCIFNKPYKCPPAPYEGALLLHDFFSRKGVRSKIDMKVVIAEQSPLPIAKDVSAEIEKLLAERKIELVKSTRIVSIDPAKNQAVSEQGAQIDFDLFIGVPLHVPPKVVKESKLGNGGWIRVNQDNLETSYSDVYAIGDVTMIPVGEGAVPKAGAFAEDGARTVVNDILNKELGKKETVKFNAAGACYLEFGEGKVAKINANFFGGEAPKVFLEGLSESYQPDKEEFEQSRTRRWFV